jgi:anoctamin-10
MIVIGTAHFLSTPYHPLNSLLLVLWSTTFVEHWRIQQRILATWWGTRGSFRVEKRRAQYLPLISSASAGVSAEGGDGERWWTREVRIAASVPIIVLFAGVLAGS